MRVPIHPHPAPAPRRRRSVLAALVAAAVTLLASFAVAAPASASVPAYSGWTLVWADDFNGAGGHAAVVGELDHRHRPRLPGRPGQLGHR